MAAIATRPTSTGTPPLLRAVEREARVFAKLWRGVAFSSFVQPLLFLGAMGLGLGRFVDDGTAASNLDGLDYLRFVTPGLLVAGAMQNAAGDSLWPVLGGMKWQGTFHGMAASPLRPADAYGGHVAFTAVRTALAAIAFLVVAGLLGGIGSPWAVMAVPATALTALAFAAPVTAYAGGCDTDVTFSLIMRLGIVPLFLFSGTFFPVEQLPDGIEWIAWLSPLWHGVELCRAFTTGDLDALMMLIHTAVLVAIVVVGWRWGTRRFTTKLAP